MCGFDDFLSAGMAAREHECAAHIHILHEIVLLLGKVKRRRKVNHTGVIDDDIDATELRNSLFDSARNIFIVAHVSVNRQRLPTCCADRLGRGVNRAFKLGVGSVGLRNQCDICAICCCTQCDRKADSTTATTHQNSLTCQRHGLSFEHHRSEGDDSSSY